MGALSARIARRLLLAALLAAVTAGPSAAQGHTEIIVLQEPPKPAPPKPVVAPGGVPAPLPASGLDWSDTPNDAGRSVVLTWQRSPSEDSAGVLTRYRIERASAPGGPWTPVDSVGAGTLTLTDATLRRDTEYFYRVTAVGPGGATPALSVTGPVTARSEWINTTRGSVLVLLLATFAAVLFFVLGAEASETKPFVRRIAGIDAIERAVARAAELGRPVLYLPGISDIDELQTVAGLVILENVARLAARAGTALRVPVSYPIPHAVAGEMVRSGCEQAGRPEAFDPDAVQLVSPEQFAYVAAVTGILLRERPAAVLYMGSFFGESLMLAETGHAVGAVQVAATANVQQLPFFVAACDHTLIGEELFAASAYLSGDARLIGSLRGVDLMKVVVVGLILVGCALETFGIHGLTALLATR